MIDWNNIEQTVLSRYEEGLRQTPQSPVNHAEGDVLVHTRMVCDALKGLPEYKKLTQRQQHIVYVAALLHDIGKIHPAFISRTENPKLLQFLQEHNLLSRHHRHRSTIQN